MKTVDYLRIILSLLLLWGVYTETGIWTTLVLFLILIQIEINNYLKKRKNSGKCYWECKVDLDGDNLTATRE